MNKPILPVLIGLVSIRTVFASLIISLVVLSPTRLRAQNTFGVTGTDRMLTSPDGWRVPAGGVTYDRSLTPWLSVGAEGTFAGRNSGDEFSLVLVTGDWMRRTQVTGAVNVSAYPVRLSLLGARHRLGVSTGPSLRWKRENFHVAGWPGTFKEGSTQLEDIREASARWDARGEEYGVIAFQHGGGSDPRYPGIVVEPGWVYSLTRSKEGVDVGWAAGLAYEAEVGRIVVGARAGYTRYRDQQMITGSHALDRSIRVGYRF